MPKIRVLILSLFIALACAPLARAAAQAGIYLVTDYPSLTLQAGATTTLPLTLHNRDEPPARVTLRVEDVPAGWKVTLLGGGKPVAAAMPATDASVPLQLRVELPAQVEARNYRVRVVAEAPGKHIELPVDVTLADELPAQLSIESKLPALRGGARTTFDYQFSVRNDSGRDLLVNLTAETPQFFEPTFTESYGTQELTSVPIKAGESKELKLSVKPPSSVQAGSYPVVVHASAEGASASTKLGLEIVGHPELRISGRDGIMSATARAGQTETVPIVVRNDGSAPAQNVELSASAPSGWKVEFEPSTVAQIEAGKEAEVQARITPSDRSLVGDYMTTVRASGGGENTSGEFRVTVQTSGLWGIVGLVIIAIAVLVLVGAVARFGRR
ncbi:MAG: NEW3 domain-containing protein [Pigmentiphaga sp.]|uniref:COG1470 family protein n=1 Tax=Pigmentiphaga sp. TaxID=1977564 RepID=UPI0029BF13A4|nr:NEW3 domain-containing protein [Pigmentiphaga sp.]MDX3906852.1 NEW3 domain-containing protein [Pigmentiphaga sp.]